ncbi:hypothetical protein OG563_26545 [Nocardia vinacea]|uniref:Uncharacterized protein n=1 Tax=Nocardia vinacea TaxID=96468 RepID=A0ABZ1YKK5_9NOCA|nr:hypothetical protein [Nocardia vinacea]
MSSELHTVLIVAAAVTATLGLLFGVIPKLVDRAGPAEAELGSHEPYSPKPLPNPHAAPFRPYTAPEAHMITQDHAACTSGNCGAKAAAISTLVGAGRMTLPDPQTAQRRRIRRMASR